MLGQGLLDLHRADVRSVMHDDLLLAPEEPEVAVFVGVHEITGIQPAVTNDLGGGIGSSQYPMVWLRDLIHTRPSVPAGTRPPSRRESRS